MQATRHPRPGALRVLALAGRQPRRAGARWGLWAAGLVALLGACAPGRRAPAPPPTVVFLSDFGTQDDSVALCKGVMYGVAPELRVVDLTHEAPVFDVRSAARLIQGTAPYYPAGTVFIAVVDPGVGTARKPIAVRTKAGKYYVGPDNGLFSRVIEDEGFDQARELSDPKYMRGSISSTFHGRDIFSPAAAYLASGTPLELLGPAVHELVTFAPSQPTLSDGAVSGMVDFIERPYGNVITDLPSELVSRGGLSVGDELSVAIGTTTYTLPFKRTFGEVPVGAELALYSSRGRLSFSVNQGDFAAKHGVSADMPVRVRKLR